MANRQKGEVAFEVEGASYTLRFTIDAICALEDRLDQGLGEIAMRALTSKRVGFMRGLMWAGLRQHHPDVDMVAAGELIAGLGMAQAGELLGEALSAAFPDREAAGEGATSGELPAGG